MRAISVIQPWGSAIAIRSKMIETRSWRTHHRGELAIHASKTKLAGELEHYANRTWAGAMSPLGMSMGCGRDLGDALPFGAIVAVTNLVAVLTTDEVTAKELDTKRIPPRGDPSATWTEREMGDFSPGRWAWILDDTIQLAEPVPCKGALGLWVVPDGIAAQVKQMAERENDKLGLGAL